jgi:oligopeptide/dipeptide ABC transporter ATP-binding protein
VELASTARILNSPLHPYTRRLFASVPRLTGERIAPKMEGDSESEAYSRSVGGGCRYAARCERGDLACHSQDPELHDAGGGHLVACLQPEDNNQGG